MFINKSAIVFHKMAYSRDNFGDIPNIDILIKIKLYMFELIKQSVWLIKAIPSLDRMIRLIVNK